MVTFFRRLPKFDYVKPKSLTEALDLLGASHNGKCRVYAGGTDLIPKLKARIVDAPELLIDLKGIPGLDHIAYDEGNGLKIGALATIHGVAHSPFVKERCPILSEAAQSIASTQVQNRGTIAGNICNAVPSADSAPALLCLGARLVCTSLKGERTIDLNDFFTGPNQTALRQDELVTEILVPQLPEKEKGVYLKLSPRSKMDLAVVGVAALVSEEEGLFKDARIGLGAVAPTPMRAKSAEELLDGERVTAETIEEAARLASEASKPIDDQRASAQYRRMMVEVLVKRAIHQALKQ